MKIYNSDKEYFEERLRKVQRKKMVAERIVAVIMATLGMLVWLRILFLELKGIDILVTE